MFREVTIGDKKIEMLANGATPFWYREVFSADFFTDAQTTDDGKTVELSDSDGKKKTENPISVLTGIFASMKPKVEEGALNLSDSEPKEVEPLNFNVI